MPYIHTNIFKTSLLRKQTVSLHHPDQGKSFLIKNKFQINTRLINV